MTNTPYSIGCRTALAAAMLFFLASNASSQLTTDCLERSNRKKLDGMLTFKEFMNLPEMQGVAQRNASDWQSLTKFSEERYNARPLWWYRPDTSANALTVDQCQRPYTGDQLRIAFSVPYNDSWLHWRFLGTPDDTSFTKFVAPSWGTGFYKLERWKKPSINVYESRDLYDYIEDWGENFNGEYPEAKYYEMVIGRLVLFFLAEYDRSFDFEWVQPALHSGSSERLHDELVITGLNVQSIARLATFLQSRINAVIKDSQLDQKVKRPVSVKVRPMLTFLSKPTYLDQGNKAYMVLTDESNKLNLYMGIFGEYKPARSERVASVGFWVPPQSKYDKGYKYAGDYPITSFVPFPDSATALSLDIDIKVAGLVIEFDGKPQPSMREIFEQAIVKVQSDNLAFANGLTKQPIGSFVKFNVGKVTIAGVIESSQSDTYIEIRVASVVPSTGTDGNYWKYLGRNLTNNEKIIFMTSDISVAQ